MMHFYGRSYSEITAMEYITFIDMYKAIEVIEAKKALRAIEVNSYHRYKKEDRNKLHKSLHKKAFPNAAKNQKVMSTREAFMAMGGA